MKYASRAGEKLKHALKAFNIDPKDKVCADLGCSTGGFTDCLIQHGAQKVYAVDTGYGVLDWNLRNNPKVVVMERTNALHVNLPEKADLITIDVGWTRQKNILPHALTLLRPDGHIISLLKTHYEANKEWLEKGKVKEEYIPKIVEKVKQELVDKNIKAQDIIKSPITGKSGKNIEYLILVTKDQ